MSRRSVGRSEQDRGRPDPPPRMMVPCVTELIPFLFSPTPILIPAAAAPGKKEVTAAVMELGDLSWNKARNHLPTFPFLGELCYLRV